MRGRDGRDPRLFVADDDESFAGVRRRDVVGGSDGGS